MADVDIKDALGGKANKATPVDADKFHLNDSAASSALKHTLWSDIKTTLAAWLGFTAASSSTATSLDFYEDTDNGSNRVRLIGPASTADVTVTLPASTGTLYVSGGTDVALADGGTGASLADPGADRIMAWDDSAGAVKFMPLADLTDEAAPATGDYVLLYGAEGDLRKADWSTLPAGEGGGLSEVVEDTSPQLGGDLDANGNNIGFDDATGITDDSGNEQLIFQKTASAVNELTITNSATGDPVEISATGDDTDVSLTITPKGAGTVNIAGSGGGMAKFTEGTPAGAEAGYAVLAPDSTAHRLQLSNNNGAFSNVVTEASTDTLLNKTLTSPAVNTPTVTSPSISLTAAHGSDDTYTGTIIAGLNNTGGVTQWDAVYLNGSSQWVTADANGSGTYPARGLAIATVSTGNATSVLVHGTVRNDAWNWTVGGAIYLSATAGGLTQTAPSTSGDKVQAVGFALTADIAFFDFNSSYLTVA